MNKILKPGITIDSHIPSYGFAIGETVYVVCDAIGAIFTTTNPSQLEKVLHGGRVSGSPQKGFITF